MLYLRASLRIDHKEAFVASWRLLEVRPRPLQTFGGLVSRYFTNNENRGYTHGRTQSRSGTYTSRVC
jgi:hypothetical protein